MLAQVTSVVRGKGPSERGDAPCQVDIDRDLSEGRSPGAPGPHSDTPGEALVVRAGQHDGRGADLAGEVPGERRHRPGIDQAGMRHDHRDHG